MGDYTVRRRDVLRSIGGAGVGCAATVADGDRSEDATHAGDDPGGFPPEKHTSWGEAASLGEGELRTFATEAPSGVPLFLGVYLTEGALDGLPSAPSDGKWDAGGTPCCGHERTLALPDDAPAAFEWAMVNWNPQGHPPFDAYGAPHFDFHFYTMAREKRFEIESGTCERARGPVTCETLRRGLEPLPDDQHPPGYSLVDAVEPGMGNHLLDLDAPEFTGGEFDHTWIWGAFDGELTFFEPMITREFLLSHAGTASDPVAMPAALPDAGWYPTEYAIRRLDSRSGYAVTLESFERFSASSG